MKTSLIAPIVLTLLACSSSAVVAPKATQTASPPKAIAKSGGTESLLEHIPATAMAAVVIRSEALALPMQYLRGGAEQQAELGAHLRAHLGVDLTRVQGIVAYATGGSAQFDWAALFRVAGTDQLVGAPVGNYREHEVRKLSEDPLIYTATVAQGLLVGTPQGLTEAMDLAAGATPALNALAPLGVLLHEVGPEVTIAAGLALDAISDPETAEMVQNFGMRYVTVTVDSSTRITARLVGSDPQRVEQALGMVEAGKLEALAAARSAVDGKAGESDPWESAGAIIAYHQLKALLEEIGPRREGSTLVASYATSNGTMLPALGIGAALGVPAFIGYVRRAKTSEANTNLERMFEGLKTAHDAAVAAAGKSKPKLKQATAKLARMSIARTPATVPCGEPAMWTMEDLDRWEALGFAPDGPTLYSYELGKPAAGTQSQYPAGTVLVLKATGDLDCDQKQSSFELAIRIGEDGGLLRSDALRIVEELE